MARTSMYWSDVTNPEPYMLAEVRARILNALKNGRDYAVDLFELTVRYWNHDVAFYSWIRYAGGVPRFSVYTDDEIYGYIDGGTSHRWAIMSDNWLSKTEPGSRLSYPGRGYARVRGRRNMVFPRPGIRARDFTGQIGELVEDYMVDEIEKAVAKGITTPKPVRRRP